MFQALNAHHQEVNCIDAASGIILSVRTIPDAASIQFNLLMMSI
jgi:hypothetical protein